MADNQNPYAASSAELDEGGGNTSGMGKLYSVPDGVEGWSWGAFGLNWIWSIGNKTWIGLLALIPLVGFVVAIILGINGRKWAWQNTRWDSVEHFNRVQKRWSIWAVCLMLIPLIGILAAIALPAYQDYTTKARLSLVLKVANEAAVAVGSHITQKRALPATLEEAGFTAALPAGIENIAINQGNGQLVITLKMRPLQGRAFALAPSLDGNGQVSWRCLHGTVLQRWLPEECRFDAADSFTIK